MSMWNQLATDLWIFTDDSCNVYALRTAEDAVIIIDAGTGAWLDHLDELPSPPRALLCTHYFRDHSAGAAIAAKRGIPVWAPEYEKEIFEDPNQHFRQRDTYIIYDNLWDLYAPIEATPLAGVLRDYDRVDIAGKTIDVLPLPGVTMSQCGIGVMLADGRHAVFCGEAIHSHGRLARIAPLQYNYNDLPGAAQCYYSALELSTYAPDLLLPGIGTPIIRGCSEALIALRENLRTLVGVRRALPGIMDYLLSAPLDRVTDHVWQDRHSVANTWYIISESGKALAIDYGYHSTTCAAWQGYPKPERRRALLHGLDGLKRQFSIDKIDVVLVSHFHDDHVAGIPVLQRVYGTQCWAAETFSDLLEHPEAHCFPCNWPVPARIDRKLTIGEAFQWEEYVFTLHPMNGHTRFSTLIGFEADGKRFAHTGDQYFFEDGVTSFDGNRRVQNHVFRNGALLDGYRESGEWMLKLRPDVVIQGHQPAMWTDAAFFKHIEEWTVDYADTARNIMPLGEDQVHFDLDSWGGWIWPYRTLLTGPEPFTISATVRNPFPHEADLVVAPALPEGWTGASVSVVAGSREEVKVDLSIVPAATAVSVRRQPFAIALTANGKRFGQVAEALITIRADGGGF